MGPILSTVRATLAATAGDTRKLRPPETVFPSPDLVAKTKEQVIDDMLAVINKHGKAAKQSWELLEHLGRIIEMGMRMTRGTTH